MTDSEFNSSYFFENDIYEEHENEVYKSNHKRHRDTFSLFLNANLKEMGFKKVNGSTFEYTFEEDKKQKIRISTEKTSAVITAMIEKKENENIRPLTVHRDKGEVFVRIMDKIMDSLEIVECKMFGLKCKNKWTESEESDDESDADDGEESESEEMQSKKSKKRKRTNDDEKTSKNECKQKRRKLNNECSSSSKKRSKMQCRSMKRDFMKHWMSGEFVAAVRLAQHKYQMEETKINSWIEFVCDNDL